MSGRCPQIGLVLVYHRVAGHDLDPWQLAVSPDRFGTQLQILKTQTTVVRLPDLLPRLASAADDRPLVAITFDDGYVDNLHNALPLLEEHGLPATIFACTGPIPQRGEYWWDALERILLWPSVLPSILEITVGGEHCLFSIGDAADYSGRAYREHLNWRAWEPPPTARHEVFVSLWQRMHGSSNADRTQALSRLEAWAEGRVSAEPRHRAVDTNELLAMSQSPRIQFGAHTINHPALAALSPAEQRLEIGESQRWLEGTLGRPVRTFAYPFGQPTDYTRDTVGLVRDEGFEYACVNSPGVVLPDSAPFELPRVQVNDLDGDVFERHLRNWFNGSFEAES